MSRLGDISLAVTHGGRRRGRSLAEVRQGDLSAEWLSDLWSAEHVTAAQEAVLVRACEAGLLADSAMAYLRRLSERESLVSPRSQRAIALFLQATDRVYRAASVLGLGRVERKVETLEGDPGTGNEAGTGHSRRGAEGAAARDADDAGVAAPSVGRASAGDGGLR